LDNGRTGRPVGISKRATRINIFVKASRADAVMNGFDISLTAVARITLADALRFVCTREIMSEIKFVRRSILLTKIQTDQLPFCYCALNLSAMVIT
jgi:hypothetical protein